MNGLCRISLPGTGGMASIPRAIRLFSLSDNEAGGHAEALVLNTERRFRSPTRFSGFFSQDNSLQEELCRILKEGDSSAL